MSDDLNKKIMQIAELFGQDSVPDNVKGLLSMLASGVGSDSSASSKNAEPVPVREEKAPKADMDDSLEMMMRLKKMMDRANPVSDPRLNLINAIKPFLNTKRQKKLGNCLTLLSMTRVAKMMGENDKV
ncbi:MAG TPA: hypothetical protein VF941_01270 [Clostridia bacterium]